MLKKIISITVVALIAIFALGIWWRYYYVFGEGVKSGELNYLVKKGNIFKTYEGKLIQSGFSAGKGGSLQSYEFEFSVTNDSLANVLMQNSGSFYDLHYTEFKHTLPWRGYSKYIVDKIIRVRPGDNIQ